MIGTDVGSVYGFVAAALATVNPDPVTEKIYVTMIAQATGGMPVWPFVCDSVTFLGI